MQLQPVIANKNYLSRSMRPWITLCQSAIDFDEVQLKFGDDARVRDIAAYGSPGGQVPLPLINGAPVWYARAICQTPAETHPGNNLWPADVLRTALRALKWSLFPQTSPMRRRCDMAARA